MAEITDHSIVPDETVLTRDVWPLRLLPPYAEQEKAGIPNGKIALPLFFDLWDKLLGIKKKEKKKAKPPPEPEGGTMKYRSRLFPGHWFPKTGKGVYEYLKNMAENDGYQVRELSYNDLQNKYPSSLRIQGYEKPRIGGHEIGVMKYDIDGSGVSNWKMARILAHEYVAAKHFTRKGLPHEANHRRIKSMSDALLGELAFA